MLWKKDGHTSFSRPERKHARMRVCAKRLPWHQAVTGVQLRWEAWGIREESRVPVRLCLKKWGPLLVGAKPKQRAAREVSCGVSPLWKPIACVKHPLVSRLHREDELIRFSKSGSKSLKVLPLFNNGAWCPFEAADFKKEPSSEAKMCRLWRHPKQTWIYD